MENKFEILLPGGESAAELVVREGQALRQLEELKVTLSGTITAPGDFEEKRKGTFRELGTNVIANYATRTITLTMDEKDPLGSIVAGVLEIHPDLAHFKINDPGEIYNQKQLYTLLKFAGAHFLKIEQHKALMDSLMKFEATAEVAFVNHQNLKGSQADKKATEIKTNLSLDFYLNVPLFTGEGKCAFFVDICVGFANGGCIFWFESVQLHELLVTRRDEIFDEQLKRLEAYVIIKKYN